MPPTPLPSSASPSSPRARPAPSLQEPEDLVLGEIEELLLSGEPPPSGGSLMDADAPHPSGLHVPAGWRTFQIEGETASLTLDTVTLDLWWVCGLAVFRSELTHEGATAALNWVHAAATREQRARRLEAVLRDLSVSSASDVAQEAALILADLGRLEGEEG